MGLKIDEQGTEERAVYQPPTIERLGTLAELTQGGTTGILDAALGGSGDEQSLPL